MFAFHHFLVVIALVYVLSPVLGQEDLAAARAKMVKECKEKTGASDADIEALRNHKAPESKEGLCLFECFFEYAHVMEEGKYNKEGLVAALTPLMGGDEGKISKLKEMAETCEKQLGDGDKCEQARKLMHCTVEKGKKFGFEYPNDF